MSEESNLNKNFKEETDFDYDLYYDINQLQLKMLEVKIKLKQRIWLSILIISLLCTFLTYISQYCYFDEIKQ